ncbi:hypothetical protein AMAG_09086 [Allomyces macrogynus ATCC 38327]|uniref:Major facilitator superfamily (MFS) profile domain-containing protein n=1 Tax=Allomyces macrogynus (strain ATCC 38327) TaxID=578462 RepID=A0A0L0SNG1_ALLM3|nr:hypothetical protein AMAG_09086 [Allomyces macrogynus ATCC 38327]|eukprot:KNE64028.1 hypothetical protein AMAG_09086 [Allomyces macrogynus ATCC 38327]
MIDNSSRQPLAAAAAADSRHDVTCVHDNAGPRRPSVPLLDRPTTTANDSRNKRTVIARYGYLAYSGLAVAMGMVHFGFHLGEFNNISKVLPCLSIPHDTPTSRFFGIALPPCIPMSTLQFSFLNAVLALSGAAGAAVAGALCKTHGRRRVLHFAALPLAAGDLLMVFAASYVQLLIGRILAGFATGAYTAVSPVFLAEMAPAKLRGIVGNLASAGIAMGLAVAGLAGYYWTDPPTWRWLLAVALLLNAVQVVMVMGVPESPTHLRQVGMVAMARVVEERFGWEHGNEVESDGQVEEVEVDCGTETKADTKRHEAAVEMLVTAGPGPSSSSSLTLTPVPTAAAPSHAPTLLEFLTRREYRRALVILGIAHASQQLSGINVFFAYSFSILTLIFTPSEAALFYLIMAWANIPVNFLPGLLVDRAGRRPLILFSMLAMALAAALFAVAAHFILPAFAMAMFLTAVVVFAVGLSNVPYILTAELVEPSAVPAAAQVALAVNALASFTVLFGTPPMLDALKEGTFVVFAVYLAIAAAALAILLPETRGRTAEEVVAELHRRSGVAEDEDEHLVRAAV